MNNVIKTINDETLASVINTARNKYPGYNTYTAMVEYIKLVEIILKYQKDFEYREKYINIRWMCMSYFFFTDFDLRIN